MEREVIARVAGDYGHDASRLIDIVRKVQQELTYIPEEALSAVASELGIHRAQVEDVVSFYSFLQTRRRGKYTIRLSHGVVDKMCGMSEVASAFEKVLGIPIGGTTADNLISLE